MTFRLLAGLALLASGCAAKAPPAPTSPPPQLVAAPLDCLGPLGPPTGPGALTARLHGPKTALLALGPVDGLMIEHESGRMVSGTDGEVFAIGTRAAMTEVIAHGICVLVIQDEAAYARHMETVRGQIVDVEPSPPAVAEF